MRRYLTIEHSVHLVMICFALASLGNVSAFLTGAGHPWYSAWLLAVALAVGLTSLSIMLTGVDRQADPATFWTITVAATALGVLSGSLQSAEYARHLGSVWSVFLGFTSPLAGEVALAFAASLYGKAHKRARFASIGADLENGVADVMIDAMASVDRAAIQRRVDRVLNQMAGLAIDSAAQKAMALYVKPLQIEQKPMPTIETEPILNSKTEPETNDVERMKAGKLRKIEQRRTAMLDILQSGEFSVGDLASKMRCSANTIRTDLDALQAAGHSMSVNGVVRLA